MKQTLVSVLPIEKYSLKDSDEKEKMSTVSDLTSDADIIELDPIVEWYVYVLLLNLFYVPEPLLEVVDFDERQLTVDMVKFLIASRLAHLKTDQDGTKQTVAPTETLIRRSQWLEAGMKPNKTVDKYLNKLLVKSLEFFANL